MIWMREEYNIGAKRVALNWRREVQDAFDVGKGQDVTRSDSARCIIDTCTTFRDTTRCPNELRAVTASLPPRLHASLHLSGSCTETGQEHTALLVSASPRYGTPQGTNRATSCPAPVTSRRLESRLALPGGWQSRARPCLAPAGGYRTIRFIVRRQKVFFSLQTTDPLRLIPPRRV